MKSSSAPTSETAARTFQAALLLANTSVQLRQSDQARRASYFKLLGMATALGRPTCEQYQVSFRSRQQRVDREEWGHLCGYALRTTRVLEGASKSFLGFTWIDLDGIISDVTLGEGAVIQSTLLEGRAEVQQPGAYRAHALATPSLNRKLAGIVDLVIHG